MGFLRRLLGSNPAEPRAAAPGGILAGLFVAPSADVEGWSLHRPTPADWPAVELKWLETVKLGTLEAILTGVPYESIDQDALHNVVRDGGEEGPWISRVRPELVTALASLEPARAREVATEWANTDEWKARPTDSPDRRTIDGLAGMLPAFTSLAQDSQRTLRPMYLLMGL